MSDLFSPMILRVAIFVGVLGLLLLAETLQAGPNPPSRRGARWPGNLLLGACDSVVARLLLPVGLAGVALWAQARGIGLFNALAWPPWLEFALSLLLLDLAIYWQHRLLHALPWLWPLHRVHHTDTTLDATSALRFHPFEIALSLAVKLALVLALGVSASAILAFEILLSSFALFTHANLALPPRLDRALRWALVTPTMHRVHHSTLDAEQRSNYGFHLSLWDRLFRSYRVQSRLQPQPFGVAGVGIDETDRLPALLREPLRRRL